MSWWTEWWPHPVSEAEARQYAEAMDRAEAAQPVAEVKREWKQKSGESWEEFLRRSAAQIAPLLGGEDD